MSVDGQWGRQREGRRFLASGDERAAARASLAAAFERVARGDHAALETVYKLTSAKVYALLLRMLPAPVADELLQEVYLTLWRRADSFDPDLSSPITWLVTVARNKAVDYLRANHVAGKTRSLDGAALQLADPAPSSLARLEKSDEAHRLHDCLAHLDEPHAQAIRDAFFGGMTYQQLAEKRGVPLGTMKSWVRRGLSRLKECLER